MLNFLSDGFLPDCIGFASMTGIVQILTMFSINSKQNNKSFFNQTLMFLSVLSFHLISFLDFFLGT